MEFFGEKDLKGKNIQEVVPELQAIESTNQPRPCYQYLVHELENSQKKTMNVRIISKEGTSEMSLQLSTTLVGFTTTIFQGVFKPLNPKMEVIIIIDAEEKIVGCNSQTLPILGYTDDQLINRPINILLAETLVAHPRAGSSGEAAPKRRKSMEMFGQNQHLAWRGDEYEKQLVEVKVRRRGTDVSYMHSTRTTQC